MTIVLREVRSAKKKKKQTTEKRKTTGNQNSWSKITELVCYILTHTHTHWRRAVYNTHEMLCVCKYKRFQPVCLRFKLSYISYYSKCVVRCCCCCCGFDCCFCIAFVCIWMCFLFRFVLLLGLLPLFSVARVHGTIICMAMRIAHNACRTISTAIAAIVTADTAAATVIANAVALAIAFKCMHL